jgi:hypothetical protein
MRIVLLAALLPLAVACNTKSPEPSSKPAAPAPAAPVAAAAGTQKLGEPITLTPTQLADIAKNPHAFENKLVATSGTVTAICQSMGCWMEIKDDASEAHIKMAGHSFFIPKSASGHKARVQAKVIKADADDECAQEAAQQTGKPVAKLQLEATGVEID